MPVYNGEKHIESAIQSILTQSIAEIELIIIDDGSTDGSVKIINHIVDERVRLIENVENRGVAYSLNKGLAAVRGKYIARMDSDDIALPLRFEKQINYLEKHPGLSMCGSWVRAFGEVNTVYKYPEANNEIKVAMLFYPCFAHPSVMWKRKDFVLNGFKYQVEPATAEDYDLWIKVAKKLEVANVPEILLEYRVDPQIKVSAYLKQQLDGDRSIKKNLLAGLGVENVDNVVDDWMKISGTIDVEKSAQLVRFIDLIEKVAWANFNIKKYDQVILNRYLVNAVYGLMVKMNVISLNAWFVLALPFPMRRPYLLSIKLIVRKIFKTFNKRDE